MTSATRPVAEDARGRGIIPGPRHKVAAGDKIGSICTELCWRDAIALARRAAHHAHTHRHRGDRLRQGNAVDRSLGLAGVPVILCGIMPQSAPGLVT